MAATYRTSVAGGATSGSANRSVSITPAVDDLFIVFVSLSGNTNATPTCSDNNSGTYTLIMRAAWSSSANNMACFVRDQLLANTTSTTVTIGSGSNTAGEIVVVAYSGMSRTGSSAVRSFGSQANQAAATTPAPALDQAALTTNPTLAAVASGDTTTAPPASWTERQDASQSTPTTALEVCTRDSGFTGTTITFGATQSTVYASMAIELDSSSVATLVTPTTATAASSAATPTVTFGEVTTTPTVAVATGAAAIPSISYGAITVTPSAAAAAATAAALTTSDSSGQTATPTPAIASAAGISPTITVGGISCTPLPANAAASATSIFVGVDRTAALAEIGARTGSMVELGTRTAGLGETGARTATLVEID